MERAQATDYRAGVCGRAQRSSALAFIYGQEKALLKLDVYRARSVLLRDSMVLMVPISMPSVSRAQ
jgi:hypothetical protein